MLQSDANGTVGSERKIVLHDDSVLPVRRMRGVNCRPSQFCASNVAQYRNAEEQEWLASEESQQASVTQRNPDALIGSKRPNQPAATPFPESGVWLNSRCDREED
jgi:hypothetical protein